MHARRLILTAVSAVLATGLSLLSGSASAAFAAACGGCHAVPTVSGTGGFASPGACAASYNAAAMQRMSAYGMTVAQQQAVQAALCGGGATTTTASGTTMTSVGSTTPTTKAPSSGASLYGAFCAGCHDGAAVADGGRNVVGARVCSIEGSLNGTSVFKAGVPQMAFLKGLLSASDIQKIADYLNSGTVTGQQRYITACAGCHGVDARGGRTGEGVRGESASETSSAIRGEGEMRYLSCLPSSDITAIGNYLTGREGSSTSTTRPATTTTSRATTTTVRTTTTTTRKSCDRWSKYSRDCRGDRDDD